MEKVDVHPQRNSILSLKTLGICLVGMAIALIAVTVFQVPVSTIGTAVILLACPLMHILMMRNGNHKH